MERLMQCGIGKCGHCNIGKKYVCQDGPIFTYEELKELTEKIW
jgi:NAD(P)H-flavin reductase